MGKALATRLHLCIDMTEHLRQRRRVWKRRGLERVLPVVLGYLRRGTRDAGTGVQRALLTPDEKPEGPARPMGRPLFHQIGSARRAANLPSGALARSAGARRAIRRRRLSST
jgi:hypothetical protein